MSNAAAYQETASTKAQEIAANQAKSSETAAELHERAREAARKNSPLSRAVAHLNEQTERGEHDPHYDPAETNAE